MRPLSDRVTLRDTRDDDGVRHLRARFTETGDLVFEGQDLGRGVERIFGSGEYEWTWTIRRAHVGAFVRALGTTEGSLLARVAERFAAPRCGDIEPFLRTHAIPFERWSRIGD